KYALTDQDGWIPKSAFAIQATTPTSGPQNHTDPQVAYVMGWKIFKKLELDTQLRYLATAEKGDHFNEWAPSVVVKTFLHEQWTAHAEYFGVFADGKASGPGTNLQYFSPGVAYLVTPNCELGVRVGWGLNQDSANFFSNVGIGLRF